jgi:hypothetical protein
MLYIGLVLIGAGIGYIFTTICRRKKAVGELVIVPDPYDEPYLFLNLKTSVSNVCAKDTVILKVEVKNYISQK